MMMLYQPHSVIEDDDVLFDVDVDDDDAIPAPCCG
jgi:hypothetical protein